MLLDAHDVDNGAVLETDLCIAGSGAAGVSLTSRFLDSGLSVTVLEGGGEGPTAESRNLYAGTTDGDPVPAYLMASRLRFLGGTTNHWLGACLTLDPIDFTARDWMPDSGWPFERSELDPYYLGAARLFELEPPEAADPPLYAGSIVGLKHSQTRAKRFGQEYREALEAAPNLRLLLNANVIQVGLRGNAGSVERLDVATFSGPRFTVRARCFVLALGGIENSRMLLVSDDVQAAGVGNGHDQVGRYFMDHAGFRVAQVCVSDRDRTLVDRLQNRLMRLDEETQRRHRLLNCLVAFGRVPEIEDSRHLVLRDGAWNRLSAYLEELGGFPESSPLGRLARRTVGDDPFFHRRFSLLPEQPPTADSRVMLGSEKDPFGNRRVHLRWRPPAEMARTARRTAELFAHELGRRGIGRLAFDVEGLADGVNSYPGFHHMGGTRMHDDPRHGVVDRHCRVHGVDNLYMAGSSVFPTSGYANPTFTLVALTLRLADHLATRLGREA